MTSPEVDPPAARGLRRAVIAWAVCSLVGAVVVAAPDSGRRVFSVSQEHGPSAADLAGVVVMLAGWAVFLPALRRARRAALRGSGPSSAPVFLLGLGGGLVVASVSGYPHWWMAGAGLLAAAQLAIAWQAVRPPRQRTR